MGIFGKEPGDLLKKTSPVFAILGEDRINKINKGLNDPWGQLMNPGKTLQNTADGVTGFVEDPSMKSFYQMNGSNMPFLPSPSGAIQKKWGNQMQAKDDARAMSAADPYSGMPNQGGTLTNQQGSPWDSKGWGY